MIIRFCCTCWGKKQVCGEVFRYPCFSARTSRTFRILLPPEKHIAIWNAVFPCLTIPYQELSIIGIRQWIATTLRQIRGIAALYIRVQKEKSNESLGQQSHSNIYLTQLRPLSSHTFTFFICAVFYAPDNTL